jgi:sugar lactone lactonase YvrE
MHVDETGRAYVGNFGSDVDNEPIESTVLVRVDPDGTAAVAAEELVFPNGTQITPDGTLIVAETFAFRISAYDVAADGTLSNHRIWADFGDGPAPDLAAVLESDAVAPDGICLDAEGALWVANATGSGALRVREGGEIVDEVGLGELTAYAVELGGPDGRTLHLCAGPPLGEVDPAAERRGAILTCRVDVPGRAWA